MSKWECGKGFPDISILIPLAGTLDITVTELLKAQRLSSQEPLKAEEVDEVVKMAITISAEEDNTILATKSKRAAVYFLCVIITCAEIGILFALGHSASMIINGILTVELLGAIFGFAYCFTIKERLPSYYDENKISHYSDGFFQMNMPGVTFNNKNWRHILSACRICSMLLMVLYPLVYLLLSYIKVPWVIQLIVEMAAIFAVIFIPVYVNARKYE